MKLQEWAVNARLALDDAAAAIHWTLGQAEDEELSSLVTKLDTNGVHVLVATEKGQWEFRSPDALGLDSDVSFFDWSDVGPVGLTSEVREATSERLEATWKLRMTRPEFELEWGKKPAPLLDFLDVWRSHKPR